jgi:hypothetical protein
MALQPIPDLIEKHPCFMVENGLQSITESLRNIYKEKMAMR